MMVFKFIAGR